MSEVERLVERDGSEGGGRCCSACDGAIESELLAMRPAAVVCLECMPAEDLRLLERDLEQLQEVNSALLSAVPQLDPIDAAVTYRPSRLLSGDFYDLQPCPDASRLRVLIGDVVGEGIGAALLRTGLQGALRALLPEFSSPALVLEKANSQFLPSGGARRFASVFLGLLDLASGELTYANAGHLPPLLRRVGGGWEPLAPTGVALGLMGQVRYADCRTRLAPGDLLVLYSDGITEACGVDGEPLGQSGLTALVDSVTDDPVSRIARSIAAAAGSRPGEPGDDQTLIVLRWLEAR